MYFNLKGMLRKTIKNGKPKTVGADSYKSL